MEQQQQQLLPTYIFQGKKKNQKMKSLILGCLIYQFKIYYLFLHEIDQRRKSCSKNALNACWYSIPNLNSPQKKWHTLLQLKINTNRTVQVWSTVLILMIFSTVVGETLHDFVPKIPQSFAHVCNFVSVMQLLFKCKMNAMLIVHYLVLMYLLHILPPT